MHLSIDDGKLLIKLARDSIKSYFSNEEVKVDDIIKERFSEKRGVFVTLHLYGELKGCIGYVEAAMPLYEAVIRAARNAAFSDSRFMPLSKDEFGDIKIEVSVLTTPELIKAEKPKDYLHKIKIGKDGLIIRKGFNTGLLLPQVAPEWKWNVEEFLGHTCQKAGLGPEEWKKEDSKVYKFQAVIFKEKDGEIVKG